MTALTRIEICRYGAWPPGLNSFLIAELHRIEDEAALVVLGFKALACSSAISAARLANNTCHKLPGTAKARREPRDLTQNASTNTKSTP